MEISPRTAPLKTGARFFGAIQTLLNSGLSFFDQKGPYSVHSRFIHEPTSMRSNVPLQVR